MNRVEDLDVFKLAHELALKIYLITKAFPKRELFSLINRPTSGNLSGQPDGRSYEVR